MKYKLLKGLEGPGVSYRKGDMIEISTAQLQGYIDKDMIVIEASAIKEIKKPIKEAEPKATKKKAKKSKV